MGSYFAFSRFQWIIPKKSLYNQLNCFGYILAGALADIDRLGTDLNSEGAVMSEIYDVFISYRRSDGTSIANELDAYLTNKGLRVFLDRKKLKDGDYFDTQLKEKLETAPHYVLIGTSGAFTFREGEDWVRNEIELARLLFDKARQERTFTVLAPEGVVFPDVLLDDLDPVLKIQRVPYSPYAPEDVFEKIFRVVTRVTATNVWHASRRWLENSKRPGGRFARLSIEEGILPRASLGKDMGSAQRDSLPISVRMNKELPV